MIDEVMAIALDVVVVMAPVVLFAAAIFGVSSRGEE